MLERLQKIIARAGVASRREAEGLITDGQVTVNGELITELGYKADSAKDHIKVNGKLIEIDEDMTYILLNKPKGVVTTVHDPEGRVTVTSLLKEVKGRLYPVGRLDFNTEGALLLTNDGNLTHKLLAPRSKCPKTYVVKVNGSPEKKTLARLERGITVDGNRFGRCEIEMLKAGGNSWLRVILYEGKNHQIKKMFETVGHPVSKLRRIAFAFLTTKGLKPGEFRYLNPVEIERLQRGDYKFLKPLNPFKFLREVGVSLKSGDYEAYRQEKGEPPVKKREDSKYRSGKGSPRHRAGQPGTGRPARDGSAQPRTDSKRGDYRRGSEGPRRDRPERYERGEAARSEDRKYDSRKRPSRDNESRDRREPRSGSRFEGGTGYQSRRGDASRSEDRKYDSRKRPSRDNESRDRKEPRSGSRFEGGTGYQSRRGDAPRSEDRKYGYKKRETGYGESRDRKESGPGSRSEAGSGERPRRSDGRKGPERGGQFSKDGERSKSKYSPRRRTRAKTGEKTGQEDDNRRSAKTSRGAAKYKAKRPQKAWAKSLDRPHKKGSGNK